MLHRESFPVPPYSGGLRCRGKLLGVSGATDMPPVPGCTLPEGSTEISTCGRAPRVLADGPIAGSPSGVSCMPLKSVFPIFLRIDTLCHESFYPQDCSMPSCSRSEPANWLASPHRQFH